MTQSSTRIKSKRPALLCLRLSEDERLLAEVLVRLGETRTANNLNQIAKHLNQGTLVVDEGLEADLKQAMAEVAWMRAKLVEALRGLS